VAILKQDKTLASLKFKTMESPVGILTLVANDDSLVAILWDNEKPNRVKLPEMEMSNHPILVQTERQLEEYFARKRTSFDIPLQAHGTAFQKAVWQALTEIPYGTTWSYKQVAEQIQQPRAVRAVAGSIGRNPISIIIPCHRVIATNGSLTGFAGGLDRKQTLLQLEHFS
jgi:methylated-DNA-[protein]-cysteine S-methyltransferase